MDPSSKAPTSPFSSSLPSLVALFCSTKRNRNRKGAPILMFLPFFFICLVKMGEVNMKFLVEVLFLGPVSLRHPGGKWRDGNCTLGYPETRGERMYKRQLLSRRSFSSATSRLCTCGISVCVCVCVPYGTVLLPYFVSQGEGWQWPASFCLGHLPLHWRQFLTEKLPDSAGFFGLKEPVLLNKYSFLCLSRFITCRRRVGA